MHHILGIGAISVVAFLPCPKIVSPNMECGMSSLADLMVWRVCVMVLYTSNIVVS